MAQRDCPPHAVATISRSRPHTSAVHPPLIGVVTHELRADAERAWAPAVGRRERDLAPDRLALRLTYPQAIQAAGGRVEALWDPRARFCLGVQWHPEVLTHRQEQAALFESLVVAAGATAPSLALAA